MANATVELPQDVADKLRAAQQAVSTSLLELQEAEDAKMRADQSLRHADQQLLESNRAAQEAQTAALAALESVRHYLRVPPG